MVEHLFENEKQCIKNGLDSLYPSSPARCLLSLQRNQTDELGKLICQLGKNALVLIINDLLLNLLQQGQGTCGLPNNAEIQLLSIPVSLDI